MPLFLKDARFISPRLAATARGVNERGCRANRQRSRLGGHKSVPHGRACILAASIVYIHILHILLYRDRMMVVTACPLSQPPRARPRPPRQASPAREARNPARFPILSFSSLSSNYPRWRSHIPSNAHAHVHGGAVLTRWGRCSEKGIN